MAIAFVQDLVGSDFSGVGTLTVTATGGGAIGAGDSVCGYVGWVQNAGQTLLAVVDDKLNSYPVSDTLNGTGGDVYAVASFCLGNIPAGGPTSITATFSGAVTFPSIDCSEFSGTLAASDPRDGHTAQQQGSPGTGSNAVTSGNITTTVNGDVLWGATVNDDAAEPTTTAGTSFTARGGFGGVFAELESRIQATAASAAATFTINPNGKQSTFIIAVQPAAAAGAGLFRNSSLDGLGAGGPFFHDPLST